MSGSKRPVVISKELITKPQLVAGTKYRYIKVLPTTGGAEIKISPNSTTQIQFEVPTRWINYSRSRICGANSFVADASGTSINIHLDSVAFISSARYRTRTGKDLFDVDFLQNYTKIVNRYDKPMTEVMSNDDCEAIFSHRGVDSTDSSALRPNNTPISHFNVEGRYLYTEDADTPFTYTFRYALSDLVPNTIFAKAHDIKLPEIAVLTLKIGPLNRYAWTTDASGGTTPVKSPLALTEDVNILDFHLLLAVQDDPVYEQMLNKKLKDEGLKMPLNYVIYSQNSRETASQNVAVVFNSGHGKRIKKIYHSVFNSDEELNTSIDNDSEKTRKVKEYYVKINDSRTTEQNLALDRNKDGCMNAYYHHKPLLEGTTITNSNIYNANFCHIEDIGRLGSPAEQLRQGIRTEDVEAGDSLVQDFKFEFVGKEMTSEKYNHYTFGIVQRDLIITESAVILD